MAENDLIETTGVPLVAMRRKKDGKLVDVPDVGGAVRFRESNGYARVTPAQAKKLENEKGA